jgi:hypothetical protein
MSSDSHLAQTGVERADCRLTIRFGRLTICACSGLGLNGLRSNACCILFPVVPRNSILTQMSVEIQFSFANILSLLFLGNRRQPDMAAMRSFVAAANRARATDATQSDTSPRLQRRSETRHFRCALQGKV